MQFSIITPSYNQLDWLRLCIASVRDQVERGNSTLCMEHIVQDAGTPGIEEFARKEGADFYRDGQLVFSSSDFVSQAACKPGLTAPVAATTHDPLQQNFSPAPYRLSIYSEADSGMYDAINRGWRRATGDVLAYLNSDEQYAEAAFANVYSILSNEPSLDLLFGDAVLLNPEGVPISYRRVILPNGAHTRVVHLTTLSCATFFRRSLLERGLFLDPSYKAIGDAEWVWRIIRSKVRMKCIPKVLAAFTITGSNMGANSSAIAESRTWRHSAPAWLRLIKPALRLHHWIKKFASGAYAGHEIHSGFFSKENPSIRQQATHNPLGFSWRSGG